MIIVDYAHFGFTTINIRMLLTKLYGDNIDRGSIEVVDAKTTVCDEQRIQSDYEIYEKDENFVSFFGNLSCELIAAESQIKQALALEPDEIHILVYKNEEKYWGLNLLCDEGVVTIMSFGRVRQRMLEKVFRDCFE